MGLNFRNKEIFLDSAPLIYFIEKSTPFHGSLKEIFTSNERGEFRFYTSPLTLAEVLVKPLKVGRHDLVSKYKQILLGSKYVEIVPFDFNVAHEVARLRSVYNVRTPDAIQIAMAMSIKAHFFFTHDKRLKVLGEEISIATLDQL